MRKSKRGFALVLAMALTMTGGMTAYADPDAPGEPSPVVQSNVITVGNDQGQAQSSSGQSGVIEAGAGQAQSEVGGPGAGVGAGPQMGTNAPAPGQTQMPQMDYSATTVYQTDTRVNLVPEYTSSGTIGKVTMTLNGVPGCISYGVYVNHGGYLPWKGDGNPSGGTEDSTWIESIQIALTGEAGKQYDVYYRGVSMYAGVHGWAKNEELMGTQGRGDGLTSIEVQLVPKGSAAPGSTDGRFYSAHTGYLQATATGATYYLADGTGYTGWVDHDQVRYYFVDGQAVTGWQYIDGLKFYFNESGALVMDVDDLIGHQDRYVLKVNKELNCLTVYAKDGDNGYIIPVKSMLTSVGDDTPVGTFTTPEKYRWRFMVNDTYTQYATRIAAGKGFLFHSITYETTNEDTLITYGYNWLGVTRSLGCVRLNCRNAKWLYDNCVLGTQVVIYNDANSPGPFFKPYQVWIPADQTWDPTDPAMAGR